MDLAAQPHHDGSRRYLDDQAPDLGDRVGVRLRVPAAIGAEAVHVRAVVDGEPKYTKATIHERESGADGAVWWQADVTIRNPVTPYRFLVETPGGVRWVNGAGTSHRDVGDRDDFVVSTFPPPPDWLADSVCYEIFPDRFARGIDEAHWVDPRGRLGDRVRLGDADRAPTGSAPSASSIAATSSACASASIISPASVSTSST